MKRNSSAQFALLFGVGLGFLIAIAIGLHFFFESKDPDSTNAKLAIQNQLGPQKAKLGESSTKTNEVVTTECRNFSEKLSKKETLSVSEFKPVRELCKLKDSKSFFLAIRTFQIEKSSFRLLVDSKSLATQVVDSRCLECVRRTSSSGVLAKALENYNQPRTSSAFNPGLRNSPTQGIFLTADLCPTNQDFEKPALESIVRLNKISESTMSNSTQGLPIGLAISGSWIKHHPIELSWIKTKIEDKSLQVTWINHSYLHPFNKDLPLNETFYLTKNFDVRKDILRNETTLLAHGLIPSVFLRFPGLYADKKLLDIATDLELITIGAGTWANQKRSPRQGDVYLFHANGNEPEGAQQLIRWIEKKTLPRPFLPLEIIFSSIE